MFRRIVRVYPTYQKTQKRHIIVPLLVGGARLGSGFIEEGGMFLRMIGVCGMVISGPIFISKGANLLKARSEFKQLRDTHFVSDEKILVSGKLLNEKTFAALELAKTYEVASIEAAKTLGLLLTEEKKEIYIYGDLKDDIIEAKIIGPADFVQKELKSELGLTPYKKITASLAGLTTAFFGFVY